jgi:pimeloyl-ACP methyl ester carboxylesterase
VQALTDLQTLDLAPSAASGRGTSDTPTTLNQPPQVAALWAQWLGQPARSGEMPLSAHWFREGGSSLGAMRMIAAVNKALQLDLALHDFLEQPTFGRLLERVCQTDSQTPPLDNLHWVGPATAKHLKVLLPGYAGSALGVFKLAQAMVAHAPSCAVLCVDLDAIVRSGDAASVFDRCQATIRSVVVAHAATHHVEVVGYSLGGLLALHTLTTLPAATQRNIHVWLLDTYAPGRLDETLLYRAERYLARRWHRHTQKPTIADQTREAVEQYLDASEADAQAHTQWNALAAACTRPLRHLQDIDATLLRTLQTAREVGLIWRNRSNGWAPARFRKFDTINLDTDHLGITQRAAGEVARILSSAAPSAVDTPAS